MVTGTAWAAASSATIAALPLGILGLLHAAAGLPTLQRMTWIHLLDTHDAVTCQQPVQCK